MGRETALERNCREFLAKLEEVADRCGRRVGDITVVAVTKTRPYEDVLAAVAAGMREIGENRVQEAERKFAGTGRDFRLHMIGHLQSNKSREAAKLFDVLQSVDSLKLAGILDREYRQIGKTGSIMLEVNTSGEPQKYGFAPTEVEAAADSVFGLGGLSLTGLMTVGPLTDDEKAVRESFRGLHRLFDRIKAKHPDREVFTTLSMGMTDDYEIAVAEGATMIRIGRALFGTRLG
jgi:PLP dependent protein